MLAQKRHKHTNGMKQNIISADIFSIGISLKFLLYMLYVNMHVDACEYICYSHTQKFIYIYPSSMCYYNDPRARDPDNKDHLF